MESAGGSAGSLWTLTAWLGVLSRQAEPARQTGALVPLFFSLIGHVFTIAWEGDVIKAAKARSARRARSGVSSAARVRKAAAAARPPRD
jgi:hypothetical protein